VSHEDTQQLVSLPSLLWLMWHITSQPIMIYLSNTTICNTSDMGWLQLVGSIKLQVSFAKEPYKRDDILQKRPVILSMLLTVATPYRIIFDPVWGHAHVTWLIRVWDMTNSCAWHDSSWYQSWCQSNVNHVDFILDHVGSYLILFEAMRMWHDALICDVALCTWNVKDVFCKRAL